MRFLAATQHRWRAATLAAGLTALAAVAVTTFVPSASAATVFSDNFESGVISGWSKSGGDWTIITDGSKVLRQSNTVSGNARQFAGNSGWTDYTVQARVKALSLGGNGAVGLLARASGATKYYRLALMPGNRVELQAVNGSSWAVLGSASRTVTTGTWYTLSITTSGTTISASIDGTRFASASSTLVAAGRIGLQTLYSSAVFDDVVVTTGGTPPSPSVSPSVSPSASPSVSPTPSNPGQWPTRPDGFASLPGMGRGPTTGGAGGQVVTVTNQADLNRYVTATEPYIIRVAGTINISPKGTELRVNSNKTIIGLGTTGEIVGGGFFLNVGVHNVIIRNLTIRDTRMPDDDPGDDTYDYDAIQLDTTDHIWIDHNRLTRMNDGLIDSRKDTTYLTVSWNHIVDNNKTFGIGWTSNVTSLITIHHNWFQNTNSRNPSADNIAACHLYNNYLQNVSGYGHFVRGLTKAVIENSYFDTVRDPYYVEAGELVQRGNIVVNSTWGDGRVREKGTAFDPRSYYPYTLDPASAVPDIVRRGAGPQANIVA